MVQVPGNLDKMRLESQTHQGTRSPCADPQSTKSLHELRAVVRQPLQVNAGLHIKLVKSELFTSP